MPLINVKNVNSKRGKKTRKTIFGGGIFPGSNFHEENLCEGGGGVDFQGETFLCTIFPDGNSPGGNFLRRGRFFPGAFFWTSSSFHPVTSFVRAPFEFVNFIHL